MSAQGKPLRCEIIHDNFQNYKKYNVPKAQLVIVVEDTLTIALYAKLLRARMEGKKDGKT